MNDDQKNGEAVTADSNSPSKQRPYKKPALTQFGPMRELTKLDPGPSEDFIAYGGVS